MTLNGGTRSIVPSAPIPAPTERRPPSPTFLSYTPSCYRLLFQSRLESVMFSLDPVGLASIDFFSSPSRRDQRTVAVPVTEGVAVDWQPADSLMFEKFLKEVSPGRVVWNVWAAPISVRRLVSSAANP